MILSIPPQNSRGSVIMLIHMINFYLSTYRLTNRLDYTDITYFHFSNHPATIFSLNKLLQWFTEQRTNSVSKTTSQIISIKTKYSKCQTCMSNGMKLVCSADVYHIHTIHTYIYIIHSHADARLAKCSWYRMHMNPPNLINKQKDKRKYRCYYITCSLFNIKHSMRSFNVFLK